MSTPAAKAVSQARSAAAPAPLRLPPAPRRVSGPSIGHPRSARAQPQAGQGRLVWVLDHPWLDRLIRSRTWIAIVAAALLAIVAMQVVLLRLGSNIGALTTKVNAQIQSNQTALTAIAALQSGSGVRRQAAVDGLVEPAPDQVIYLSTRAADAQRAAARMRPPSAAATAAELADRTAAARAGAATTATPHRHRTATTRPATGATGAAGAVATGGAIAETTTPTPTPTTTSASTTTTGGTSSTPAASTTPSTSTSTKPSTSTPPASPPAHATQPPPVSAQGGAVAPAAGGMTAGSGGQAAGN